MLTTSFPYISTEASEYYRRLKEVNVFDDDDDNDDLGGQSALFVASVAKGFLHFSSLALRNSMLTNGDFIEILFEDCKRMIANRFHDASIISIEFFITLFTVSTITSLLQCCKKKATQCLPTVSQSQTVLHATPHITTDPKLAETVNPPPAHESPPKVLDMKSQPSDQKSSLPENKEGGNIKPSSEKDLKNEDVTQNDETIREKKDDDIVDPENVAKLGNLDYIAKEKRAEMLKEIELIKSTHEMEGLKDPSISGGRHVAIVEKRCKLYEITDEPTLDDELDDNAI